jgi:DeoR/GlpR family transcriptional regulator of sugar metabolism
MTTVLSATRRAEVLQWVQTHGTVHVTDLARSLGVSSSTIRRDLTLMEEEGLLHRVHGGAVVGADDVEPQRRDRAVSNATAKSRIGAAAARFVEDDSTILISGGTTTEAMLPHILARQRLTVVTNSLTVATHLADRTEIAVVVLGGYLRPGELSLLGHMTRSALDDLIVDRTFSGAFGLDRDGVTGANVAEAGTDRHLMAAARSLVVLADSSKFGRRGPARLARTDRISVLVTDGAAPSDELAALTAGGVEVVVA